jgi:hypothetical protein
LEIALDKVARVCFNSYLDIKEMKRRVSGVSKSPRAWPIMIRVARVERRVAVIIAVTGD